MARTCQCWKTYKCLLCTDNEERALRAERVVIKREPRVSANRKIPDCGTRSGYNRHLRLKEPTCAECKAAQAESVKRLQREKRLLSEAN